MIVEMRVVALMVLLIVAWQGSSFAIPLAERVERNELLNDSFPVPKNIQHMLFYVQRTPNINTVVYELNLDEKGQLNKSNPVHVFWIRYAEEGQREELSFIQRFYAYGLKTKDLGNNKYELRFVSYKKIPFYLYRSAIDNQFRAHATLAKKEVLLKKIFLQIEGGTFWFPNVVYIEFTGIDPVTGQEIIERIKP